MEITSIIGNRDNSWATAGRCGIPFHQIDMDGGNRASGSAKIRKLIVEQDVEGVQHFHTPNDLFRLGRHSERIALAKGIRFHVHDRTIIDGHRAKNFPD